MNRRQRKLVAELAALADGSLAPSRRAPLLERIERSPELARELARQREALALIGSLEGVSAPTSLHRTIEARATGARTTGARASAPRARVSLGLRVAGVSAVAAALVVLVAVALSGAGATQPRTMRQVASLALARATAPAPATSQRNHSALADDVEGVWFPSWRQARAWQPAGSRVDRIAGRTVRVVFYQPASGSYAGSSRIGYAIVSGPALSSPKGEAFVSDGIDFHAFQVGGSPVLTWRRAGHTCVLAGRGVTVATLAHLAAYA